MADELDPKLDEVRYYKPPGVTEPILRPEFAAEEAAKAAAHDEGPIGPSGKKPRAVRKTKASKKATPAAKKK